MEPWWRLSAAFAFWHSGAVDLPIKWSDFAASIGIPVGFVRDLAGGEAEYASFANCIKVPSLWTSLTASPYPIRSEALLKVLRYELGFIEGMTMEDMLASRIEGFEAHGYFSRIAAEGRAELNRALAALVERNEQLASVTVELHAARKKYSDLENSRTPAAIVLVTLKTIRRTIRPIIRLARRFRKRVDSSPLSNDRELLELFDSDWYFIEKESRRQTCGLRTTGSFFRVWGLRTTGSTSSFRLQLVPAP